MQINEPMEYSVYLKTLTMVLVTLKIFENM